MSWSILTTEEQFATLLQQSYAIPQVIYKHSSRCGVSSVIKNRLEKSGIPDNIRFHYFDLIANRPLSNKIAAELHVHHESPQVLLIKNGECIFDESHIAIQMDEIIEQIA